MRQGTHPWAVLLAYAAQITGTVCVPSQCPRSPVWEWHDQSTCEVSRGPVIDLERSLLSNDKPLLDVKPANRGWEGPFNCVGDHCVFANTEFGEGCVLITTPANAEIVAEMAAAAVRPQFQAESFQVADVPGKGIGLIATRAIRMGEQLMVRTPTLVVQDTPQYDMTESQQDQLYRAAVQKLPAARRRAFMKQVGSSAHNKVEKNAFRLFLGGEEDQGAHLASYPEAARANHACRPNAQYRIKNLTHSTVAVRDIAAGEELTVTYVDAMLPRAQRQARLRDWGFNCTCAHCAAGEAEGAESDARLRRIAELEKKLDDFTDLSVTAETGAELVALYQAEQLDIYLGHVYTRAALNFALLGDTERASEYAALAVVAVEREFGPEAGDIESMRMLAEDPQNHWTWGRSRYG